MSSNHQTAPAEHHRADEDHDRPALRLFIARHRKTEAHEAAIAATTRACLGPSVEPHAITHDTACATDFIDAGRSHRGRFVEQSVDHHPYGERAMPAARRSPPAECRCFDLCVVAADRFASESMTSSAIVSVPSAKTCPARKSSKCSKSLITNI
jgi:hypothetical protein